MNLDNNKLKSVFQEMGYEIEFDSKNPGVMFENSLFQWSDLPLVYETYLLTNDTIVKTTKIKNLTFEGLGKNNTKHSKDSYSKGYRDGKQQYLVSSNVRRLVA